MSTIVWAFGSNLDPDRMRRRCPSARKIGPFFVHQAALVFRAVADVVVRKGSKVPGGLWEISEADERALDSYEGVSQGLYKRFYFTATVEGRKRRVLFYKMQEEGIMPPSHQYIDTIMRGYRYFGLDLKYLETALEEAHTDKNKTDYLKWRFKRDRPTLAKRSHIQDRLNPRPKQDRPKQPVQHLFEESPRYVRNLYGETRLIKRSDAPPRRLTEERVWDKIDAAKLGVTNIVKAKRGKRKSAKLSRKGM